MGWVLLLLLLAIIVAAVFALEWLGSERPQTMVDQPLSHPAERATTD